MIRTNRYIGSPVERIEDLRFLRGRGQFVGDLKRENMLHAAILRSPVAHGLVAAVDASAALAISGVRAVITAKDIRAVPRIPLRLLPLPGTERFLQPVIAADRVRYVGEPLAVVLGDSPALAEDGVGAIALDIAELPPVPDRHASGRGEILLFEGAGTNAAMVFTGVKGDADAAFRDADYVRQERFAVQRCTALPMEPRGLLAEWDAAQGRMTVLGAAKVPFFNRDTLAAMLGLSPPQVDLIENDVGGGFGAGRRSARCKAARSTGATTASPSPALSRAAEADGTVSVYVGSTAVGQGLETVMAQIAADTLGMPLGQVRVLHGSTPFLDEGYGAFASRSTVLGGSAVFEAANALLAKIRAAAGARLGCAAEQIELADGCARAADGRSLAFAQLAADGLRVTCPRVGLPLGQVRVLHGSTPFLDEGYGAFASRSTVLGGSAVFEAANALLAKIRAAAGARLGCADDPPHTVGQLGGAERPNVLLLPAPVAGGGRGCMLSLFVVWDAAAVAFRVSAGFGAACSRFSLSDGPNRSNWRMDAPAPPTGARWHSPNWRRTACGSRRHSERQPADLHLRDRRRRMQQPQIIVVVPQPYVPQPPQPTYVSPPTSQRIWWCRTSQRWYPDVGSCADGWTR